MGGIYKEMRKVLFFLLCFLGMVKMAQSQFIYEHASFPECHASTIAETPGGLVAAWFGGTNEGNPDVCIYVSRKNKGQDVWTVPVNVGNGIVNDTLRYPCYNPVLYRYRGETFCYFIR